VGVDHPRHLVHGQRAEMNGETIGLPVFLLDGAWSSSVVNTQSPNITMAQDRAQRLNRAIPLKLSTE